ncbi:MAG: hypothetical protein HYX69_13535 [Planctomycetia bacterium]|nr:hypothetical protein [Planctomycetia bacterium]
MAKNIKKLAAKLGARIVGRLPNTGGGAFGAACLAALHDARIDRRRTKKNDKRPPK